MKALEGMCKYDKAQGRQGHSSSHESNLIVQICITVRSASPCLRQKRRVMCNVIHTIHNCRRHCLLHFARQLAGDTVALCFSFHTACRRHCLLQFARQLLAAVAAVSVFVAAVAAVVAVVAAASAAAAVAAVTAVVAAAVLALLQQILICSVYIN
jgi:hypothetical protein